MNQLDYNPALANAFAGVQPEAAAIQPQVVNEAAALEVKAVGWWTQHVRSVLVGALSLLVVLAALWLLFGWPGAGALPLDTQPAIAVSGQSATKPTNLPTSANWSKPIKTATKNIATQAINTPAKAVFVPEIEALSPAEQEFVKRLQNFERSIP